MQIHNAIIGKTKEGSLTFTSEGVKLNLIRLDPDGKKWVDDELRFTTVDFIRLINEALMGIASGAFKAVMKVAVADKK